MEDGCAVGVAELVEVGEAGADFVVSLPERPAHSVVDEEVVDGDVEEFGELHDGFDASNSTRSASAQRLTTGRCRRGSAVPSSMNWTAAPPDPTTMRPAESLTQDQRSGWENQPMTTSAQQRHAPRWVLPFLAALIAALIAALAAILLGTTASASATGGAEDRVGAISQTVEPAVEPPQHVSAGQHPGRAEISRQIAVATGVAAKTADDWPILSGIVRDAGKEEGNFGVGSGTASQATRAGESWVGDGYRIASDGKTLVSRDGLRTFRPPAWKPDLGRYQANFSYWIGERAGKPFENGHFDVTDIP